jgi:hypothetical protein
MYTAIMQWAKDAFVNDYDFTSVPISYQTVLSRMMKMYATNHSGGPPISERVHILDYAPVRIYWCFDFIKQVECLLSDPNLVSDALWNYNPQLHQETGERVYAEMNTGAS